MSADPEAQGLALAAHRLALTARRSLPVYNPAGLAAWHAALANRDASPARVVWLGDSITEGQGAASYGTRWVDRALASLRRAHPTPGVAGGFGYLPAMNQASQLGGATEGDPYASKTGNPLFLDGFGLGGNGAQFPAAGDGLTFAFSGTSVDVHYLTTFGGGVLSIRIDADMPVTIATAGDAPGVAARWRSAALSPGAHSVTVTSDGGGTVHVCGIAVFDGDEAAGIHGYGAGKAAARAATFDSGDPRFLWPVLAIVEPQLVAIALGTNDYADQVAPAVFRTHLQAIVASVRAQVPACAVALIAYARPGHVPMQAIGWDRYVAAMYAVADADGGGLNGASGVAVIDLSRRLPDAAISGMPVDALGLYTADRVHPGPKGHAAIGAAVGAALGL